MADVTCEDPLNDRHGVMIVGDPMSAKTKAYMLLAETLTTMSERKIPEHHEFRVRNNSNPPHAMILVKNSSSPWPPYLPQVLC